MRIFVIDVVYSIRVALTEGLKRTPGLTLITNDADLSPYEDLKLKAK